MRALAHRLFLLTNNAATPDLLLLAWRIAQAQNDAAAQQRYARAAGAGISQLRPGARAGGEQDQSRLIDGRQRHGQVSRQSGNPGARLAAAREQAGLTLMQVAERLRSGRRDAAGAGSRALRGAGRRGVRARASAPLCRAGRACRSRRSRRPTRPASARLAPRRICAVTTTLPRQSGAARRRAAPLRGADRRHRAGAGGTGLVGPAECRRAAPRREVAAIAATAARRRRPHRRAPAATDAATPGRLRAAAQCAGAAANADERRPRTAARIERSGAGAQGCIPPVRACGWRSASTRTAGSRSMTRDGATLFHDFGGAGSTRRVSGRRRCACCWAIRTA